MGRLEAILMELRKRKVFRAAAAYGIVTFGVLQVAEPVMHGLQLPDWVLTAVIAALVLAFPVAMVLAWIFDVGPSGLERTDAGYTTSGESAASVPPSSDRQPPSPFPPAVPRRWARKPTWAAIGLLAVAAAALAAWQMWPRDTPPAERIAVAVADVANGTSDPELDGLSTMLITALEQSRHVSVLTRTRMNDLLRQMGRQPAERVDESLGRELAVRAGARALLTASVHRFDRTYAIELKALDPVTSQYLFAAKEEGNGKGSVPGMIDRLSDRARRALRERDAEIRASRVEVGTAVTRDLGALAHYARALQLRDRGDDAEVVASLEKAIAIDPDFGLAHLQIAFLGEGVAVTRERQERAAAEAVRLAPRLPEKERLLVQGWVAQHEGRRVDAEVAYRRAIDLAPGDKEVLYLAGDMHHHAGEPALAVPYFEQALAIDPGWPLAAWHLLEDYKALGRKDEMLAVAERAARARPDENARYLVEARLARGEVDEALAAAREGARSGDPEAILLLLDVLLGQGRVAEAEGEARRLLAPGVVPDFRVEGWHALSKVSMLRGRDADALGELLAATREKGSRSKAIHAWEAYLELAIYAHDREGVRRGLAALGTLGAPTFRWAPRLLLVGDEELARQLAPQMPPGDFREAWRAVEAWRRGDRATAEPILRRLGNVYWLALLLAEAGRDAEVVETLRETVDSTWLMVSVVWVVPRARILVARSLHRLGRDAEALAELGRLRALLDRPDPGWQPLADARALEAEIRRGGGARATATAPPR
ncbi:MAG TPA: hypothetical protein VFM45_07565 [Anaeromyxobacteraceae bacterium]|nr:hypothetical protein [Anaeromyxobacteraceae bacterium]